jgi:hypothetical protein
VAVGAAGSCPLQQSRRVQRHFRFEPWRRLLAATRPGSRARVAPANGTARRVAERCCRRCGPDSVWRRHAALLLRCFRAAASRGTPEASSTSCVSRAFAAFCRCRPAAASHELSSTDRRDRLSVAPALVVTAVVARDGCGAQAPRRPRRQSEARRGTERLLVPACLAAGRDERGGSAPGEWHRFDLARGGRPLEAVHRFQQDSPTVARDPIRSEPRRELVQFVGEEIDGPGLVHVLPYPIGRQSGPVGRHRHGCEPVP